MEDENAVSIAFRDGLLQLRAPKELFCCLLADGRWLYFCIFLEFQKVMAF